tara:strand:- start:1880 stop:2512 length:633 start_codon:yes stop_codon:yes gene_type:complete
MVNYECKKLQIKAHLEKYKAFKNGCEEYKITEEDLINSIFIGGTNEKFKIFLDYNLKKYNIKLDNITKYPKQINKCLCNQSLKNLFYLYHQKKNCILVIGSECITNFTETKIKLSCLNCGRTNAKYLDKNGLCCDCMKFKCNKCFDNYIYKNNMCIDCNIGFCLNCLKKIDEKYKYCYDCNQKKNKIKCSKCKIRFHNPNFNCCFLCYKK